MSSLIMDISLCIATYIILLGFIFWKKYKRNDSGDSSSDDEGGLPVETDPKLDLPPGVCLPGSRPTLKRSDKLEELLA
ncbi:MAG: hypothetical protein ACI92W_000513 [Paraglaciecola sp.]|jgi:hypothetical protein